MFLNCDAGEDAWETLGLQGDPISPISPFRKSVLNIHWKDWCWSWNSNTLATWCKELTNWKRPWCWERLKAGEGNDRGWDGWMASPTQWTWVWVNFVGNGQGGLACYSPWGRKELDTTERLNWIELNWGSHPLPILYMVAHILFSTKLGCNKILKLEMYNFTSSLSSLFNHSEEQQLR